METTAFPAQPQRALPDHAHVDLLHTGKPLFTMCRDLANDHCGLSDMPANNFVGSAIYLSEMSALSALRVDP